MTGTKRARPAAAGRRRAAGSWLLLTAALAGCGAADDGRRLGDELRSREQQTAAASPADSAPPAVAVDTAVSDTAPAVIPWVPDDSAPTLAAQPPAAEAPAAPTAALREWTAGVVERRGGGRPVLLRAVRAARNDGFDRVVFEFAGTRVPGFHVQYVDRPIRRCGSGNATEVAGQGWLQVHLEPAQAHDDVGQVTVSDREQALALPVLRELELTCDFEAQVEWVLGVAAPNRYRVLELRDPTRLVVDVMQ